MYVVFSHFIISVNILLNVGSIVVGIIITAFAKTNLTKQNTKYKKINKKN